MDRQGIVVEVGLTAIAKCGRTVASERHPKKGGCRIRYLRPGVADFPVMLAGARIARAERQEGRLAIEANQIAGPAAVRAAAAREPGADNSYPADQHISAD